MAGKRNSALSEAQSRLRAQLVRQDKVIRAFFKASADLQGLAEEEARLRAKFEADLGALALRREAAGLAQMQVTAAAALIIGDDAQAADVLGVSARQVSLARRAVGPTGARSTIDRLTSAEPEGQSAPAQSPPALRSA